MSKNSYKIQTPHGLITRKSHREYTHIVYDVSNNQACHVSFCGSLILAQKEAGKRNGAVIAEAVKVGQ